MVLLQNQKSIRGRGEISDDYVDLELYTRRRRTIHPAASTYIHSDCFKCPRHNFEEAVANTRQRYTFPIQFIHTAMRPFASILACMREFAPALRSTVSAGDTVNTSYRSCVFLVCLCLRNTQ